SEIAFTACRPARARATAAAIFWTRQLECLAQDLVLEGFLAGQPLQFAHVVMQSPVFRGGHHLLPGPHTAQRALGIEPPPGEQLVRCDPALPRPRYTDIPGA